MTDFSHLNKLEVQQDKLVDYPMYEISGEQVLKLAPATQANKSYFNALLRKTREKSRALQTKDIDAKVLDANREEDRELYAAHVVKGWEGVTDSAGKLVEFDKDSCLGFLEALPDWIFDNLRNFASKPQNFTEKVIDTEDVAKN